MPRTYTNNLFMEAAAGKQTARPPIWLMRQAGRTDPAYNALRERCGLPLEDLFRHPELAAEISSLPKRLGIDAIIFFQDILTPLAPLGCEFVFRPGPVTDTPVRSAADVDALKTFDVADELSFVGETFRLIEGELKGEMPVLGFAGAPLTLAVFMIEGKSFGGEGPTALRFLQDQPEAAHRLLDKLTSITAEYMRYQIECGAAAVQLFESAANLCTPEIYREFALPYQQRIFDAIGGSASRIIFAREWEDVDTLKASGADILSLPSTVTIPEARMTAGEDQVVQGNLDNHLLLRGPLEDIERVAKLCVDSGGRKGHIFNLSHGLLRDTPYEHVQHLVKVVREY